MRDRCAATLLIAVVAITHGCGARRVLPTTPHCVDPTRISEQAVLRQNTLLTMDSPCPANAALYLRDGIRMVALEQGLRLQFDVFDSTPSIRTATTLRRERDAVIVYPSGEGLGRPANELNTTRTTGGYRVCDTIPWSAWGLTGPNGSFLLQLSVFDRRTGVTEGEVRVQLHLRVLPAVDTEGSATAPGSDDAPIQCGEE